MIYTFYSYERKVGRSMTLSNVADLFYQKGLRVLVVDWDLESPGIENFFLAGKEKIEESSGVMDILQDYKARISTPISQDEGTDLSLPFDKIESYLLDVYRNSRNGGKLYLLPAGRRGPNSFSEYINHVKAFDLQDFYQNWEGRLFFEKLRERFEEIADVVLIDTNAGMSDMTKVCTSHFANVVVMLCGISSQSLTGTSFMANDFCSEESVRRREGRALNLLIIPARIDYAEAEMLNEFKLKFLHTFAHFEPPELKALDSNFFWKLKIPNIPYYEYREALVVRQADQAIAEDLAEAYKNLAETMEKFTGIKPAEPLAGEEGDSNKGADSPSAFERFRKLRERKTETPTIFISYAREDEAEARAIYQKLDEAGFKPWLDKEALLGGQDWEMVIEEMIEKSDFVLTCLSSHSINKRGYVQKEIKKTLEVVGLQPEGTVYLIPLRLDKCEIPRSLGKFNCVDVFEENSFERLERSIRAAWRRSRMQRP